MAKKIKKINRGKAGKGKAPTAKKKTAAGGKSTKVKKRDYTRTAYQKKARKGNDLLRELELKNITSDNIEMIKNALEIFNTDIKKAGRKDRFFSGNTLSKENEAIMNNLIDELYNEVQRIKKALASEERQKQDDISDQDYIDEIDTLNDILNKSFSELGLSSQQIKDISDIARAKGMHMDSIDAIKRDILQRMVRENILTGMKMRDINVDKFSAFMRDELYNA